MNTGKKKEEEKTKTLGWAGNPSPGLGDGMCLGLPRGSAETWSWVQEVVPSDEGPQPWLSDSTA